MDAAMESALSEEIERRSNDKQCHSIVVEFSR
jgi:hypothetical protein